MSWFIWCDRPSLGFYECACLGLPDVLTRTSCPSFTLLKFNVSLQSLNSCFVPTSNLAKRCQNLRSNLGSIPGSTLRFGATLQSIDYRFVDCKEAPNWWCEEGAVGRVEYFSTRNSCKGSFIVKRTRYLFKEIHYSIGKREVIACFWIKIQWLAIFICLFIRFITLLSTLKSTQGSVLTVKTTKQYKYNTNRIKPNSQLKPVKTTQPH